MIWSDAQSSPLYGPTYPCAQNSYTIELDIAGIPGSNTQNQAELFTGAGSMAGGPVIIDVPKTEFKLDGTSFIFRRLTGIAQHPQDFSSGEWFGFSTNFSNRPDLNAPDIAYIYTTVSYGANGPYTGSIYEQQLVRRSQPRRI